jgi:hypothetical protein
MKDLTSQQKKIVERIRTLHKEKQPLNISAVKRHQPKLLEQVMSLKHFRGWRKAIEAAGLSYKRIYVELLDHCVCALCGEKLLSLDGHVRAKHRMTKDKYRKKFPNEETMSDLARAEKTEALKKSPHWEPVWSREYIIDYLIYKHEKGEDLSPWTVYRNESALHGNIKKYFGSYRAGIEAAGIDYREVRVIELTEQWTPQKVLDRIRKLHQKKPLNSSSDIRRRDSRLYDSCHRYFGGPVPAIEAAGIPYVSLKFRRSRQWTKSCVLQTIRTLESAGASLRPNALSKHLVDQTDEFLAVAKERFGSWENAVRAAGIDYDTYRARRVIV